MYGNGIGYLHLALILEDIHAYREEIVSRGTEIDIEPRMGMSFFVTLNKMEK